MNNPYIFRSKIDLDKDQNNEKVLIFFFKNVSGPVQNILDK